MGKSDKSLQSVDENNSCIKISFSCSYKDAKGKEQYDLRKTWDYTIFADSVDSALKVARKEVKKDIKNGRTCDDKKVFAAWVHEVKDTDGESYIDLIQESFNKNKIKDILDGYNADYCYLDYYENGHKVINRIIYAEYKKRLYWIEPSDSEYKVKYYICSVPRYENREWAYKEFTDMKKSKDFNFKKIKIDEITFYGKKTCGDYYKYIKEYIEKTEPDSKLSLELLDCINYINLESLANRFNSRDS